MGTPATRPLTRLERAGIALFFLLVIGFGGLVEYRSAFLSRRMGDLGCFLRGAWAVESGAGLYDVVDDNRWHYNYPPLFAILMLPFADPPAGVDAAGHVPYAVSVAVFYALSIAALFWGAHTLASALETRSADASFRDQSRFCRRWWALRVWPMVICLVPIGHTAMRGQVNLFILALLCGAAAAVLRGQRLRSGLLLAVAACIKVVPLYLLVYPAWRRDARAGAGAALGLFLGLVAVPLAALGPQRMAAEYQTYGRVFFGPLLGMSEDESRRHELLGVNGTDSVGVRNAMHNWMYPVRDARPEAIHPLTTWAYRLIGVGMTLAVVWPRGDARRGGVPDVLQMGGLFLLMVVLSPVNHLHYFTFALPAVMALLAARWEGRATLWIGWDLALAFALFVATLGVSLLPGFEALKDKCVPLVGGLAIWAVTLISLWKRRPNVQDAATHAEPLRRAA